MRIPHHAIEAAQLIDRLERLARSGVDFKGLNPAQWDALRYIARANRFSRTPAALAAFQASTRGTVSQTLLVLEAKGFIARTESPLDRRSVHLALTDKGQSALDRDPLLALAADIAGAAGGDAGQLVAELRAVLATALERNGGKAFGVCRTCRHFRARRHPKAEMPHHCALLDTPLSNADSLAICVEQADAEEAQGHASS